jgi:hypothetical protein
MDWVGLGGLLTVLGGGLAWLLKWMWEKRKEDIDRIDSKFGKIELKLEACEKERESLVESHKQETERLNRRIEDLEKSTLNVDIPCWKRTQSGVVISISREFVRLFCAPFGYRNQDIIGKRFEELDRFPKEFREALTDMDSEVLMRGYSSRHGIPIGGKIKATVIKTSCIDPLGEITFIGYAAPELS